MEDLLIVYLTAILMGGLAIPLGFLLEQPALAIYVAAVLGAITGMVIIAFAGTGIRAWMMRGSEAGESAQRRADRLLGSWGVKGLGLFGPTFPKLWRPYSPVGEVIFKDVPCCGCLQESCIQPDQNCLDLIEVDEVWEKIKQMLATLQT